MGGRLGVGELGNREPPLGARAGPLAPANGLGWEELAGQESGRRGTADTRLAKLLGEMALINHPKGERQKVI